MIEQFVKFIEVSLASISLAGSGAGIGVVFVGLILGLSLINNEKSSPASEELQPVGLPNYTIWQNIFQLLYTILLFILFNGHHFFVGVSLHCLLLIAIYVYYIGFKNRHRFNLF
jgi:hypothetical protein